jgi:hypothetical protein
MLLVNLNNSEIFFFEDLVEVYRGEEVQPLTDPEGGIEEFVKVYSPPPEGDRGS